MVEWTIAVIDGLIMTGGLATLIYTSLFTNPRLWLQDFPKDIQEQVPPKTKEERRKTLLLAVPFVLVAVGMPVYSLVRARPAYGGDVGFVESWLHLLIMFLIFNLFDLLIIDWLTMSIVKKPLFPGTEGSPGYRDYRFHFVGFLKGCLFALAFGAVIGGAMSLLL